MRFLSLTLLVACGGGVSPTPDRRQIVAEFPATENRNLDILFVIDNTLSDEQFNLGLSLPAMFGRLEVIPGGLPDLHIGVITSDMGTSSSGGPPAPDIGTVGQGGCSGRGGNGDLTIGQSLVRGTFISDVALTDGARQRNYDGDLADVMRSMVIVGASGCGFEQPLAALRAALDSNPANDGFRRSDAALAVIIMMDEDDCSVRDPALFGPESFDNPLQSFRCTRFGVTCQVGGKTPDEMHEIGPKSECGPNISDSGQLEDPAGIHDFVLELVGDSRRVVVGELIGDVEPFEIEARTINGTSQAALHHSCSYAGPDGTTNTPDDQVADPGVRLKSFADAFPRSAVGTICNNDLSQPLADIGQLAAFAVGTPCIAASLPDLDPDVDGLQPDCIVTDTIDEVTTVIPDCEHTSDATCWELVIDPTCVPADHLRLDVHRPAPPDPQTVTTMRCTVL